MRNFIYLILSLLLLGCSNKPIHNSTWNSDEVIIDGTLSDLKKELTYDKKSKLLYALANDQANLLLCLKVTESAVANKILRRGLTVWIDTTGKQKKVLGIKYPMGRSESVRPEDRTRPRQPIQEQQGERPVRSQIQSRMELIGFKEKGKSEVVSLGNAAGIEVAAKTDPYGGMQYEAKIPLNLVLEDQKAFLSVTDKYISIGFETGYINMNSTMRTGQSGTRMGGGGGRPPGGGGRPPGGMAQRQGDMASMTQPTRLWLKRIKLANKE